MTDDTHRLADDFRLQVATDAGPGAGAAGDDRAAAPDPVEPPPEAAEVAGEREVPPAGQTPPPSEAAAEPESQPPAAEPTPPDQRETIDMPVSEQPFAQQPLGVAEVDRALADEQPALSEQETVDEQPAVGEQDEPDDDEYDEADEQEDDEAEVELTPAEIAAAMKAARDGEDADDEDVEMNWYILKVQSNRERSIAEALQRRIAVEGLDRFFDQVIVPTEKITEFKGGKKKVVERKLYPGYIVVHMHINDDTWFAVRETSGVGDFTGAGGKPTPMLPHEVSRIIQTEEEETDEAPKLDIKFNEGDKVKVKEGNFESFEGEVSSIDEASGRVTVMINIFGRSTPVELEYWQVETV